MNPTMVSEKGLDLIRKWEGFYLKAYLCPAGVPTIGYGITVYPDGRKVSLGDEITQQQAEAYLVFQCRKIAKEISAIVPQEVPLNQNQFDAVVSFCFNLGCEALEESTLLKKLRKLDYQGAADELPRWVHAIVNGNKIGLPGLVARRNEEKALFLSKENQGTPIDIEDSPQDQVSRLEGYRDGQGRTVIVAWRKDRVIEAVTLARADPSDLIDLLRQYPHAESFQLAPEGKAIPEGSEIIFTGAADKIGADKAPPKPSGVLRLGSKGKDVRVLQARLKELGYYKGEVDGIFGDMTDKAARRFQADHFGAAEADGKAGPRTWGRLWGTDATPPAAPVPFAPQVPKPGKNYLRLVRTGKRDKYKCDVLSLKYIKDGLVKDALEVCSGAPGKQIFRKGVNSVSKSLEPLPEGKWSIQDIKWADAPDIYDGKVFSTGIGPVSTPLRYAGPGATGRSAIEVHIDWNRRHNNPGTAGCVGIYSVADYRRFVEWLRDTNPRDLYVDWGLGTCPQTP